MRTLLIALIAMAAAIVADPGSAYAQGGGGVGDLNPDSAKRCSICHYEWMPVFLNDMRGTGLVPYQKERVVAEERMCFSCHNGTVADSRIHVWAGDRHAQGKEIPEGMTIPAELPLDGGQIACRTCHTAHGTGSPMKETVENSSVFLRMENADSQLCKTCHTFTKQKGVFTHPEQKIKGDMINAANRIHDVGGVLGSEGQVICQSCHTPHSPSDKKLLVYYKDEAKICAVCHTEKISVRDESYVKGMLNHPINVKHTDPKEVAQMKKDGGVYGTGDKVICLTCHSPHKGVSEGLLIKPENDDTLCTTCHADHDSVINTPHDMHKVKGFKTKRGNTAAETGTCASCHGPHGWALDLPNPEKDLLTRGCLSCHQPGGFGDKAVIDPNKFNHPVGKEIEARKKKNENLPLFNEIVRYFTERFGPNESREKVTCATCHDVHAKGENFLREDISQGELCRSCHGDMAKVDDTKHGPKELEKSCLSCHQVHNSNHGKLLKQKKDDGCTECHKPNGSAKDSLIGIHGHPVDVRPKDVLPEGFELEDGRLSCTTCHDPHSKTVIPGVEKQFVKGSFGNKDEFCVACHDGQKVVGDSDHDVRKRSGDSLCGECHTVHNAKSPKYMMKVEAEYAASNDYCTACHNPEGSADKKVADGGHTLGKVKPDTRTRPFLEKVGSEYHITCQSCHTVHENGPAKGKEGIFSNSFLDKGMMADGGGNLCLACHDDLKQISQSPHSVTKFEDNSARVQLAKNTGDSCGVCHDVHNSGKYLFDKRFDGNIEKICTDCHKNNGIGENTAVESSHPVDVKLTGDMTKKKLFLVDGQMVCATCHDPHGTAKGLVPAELGDNACLACHDSKKTVNDTEHDVSTIDYVKAETKELAARNSCAVCHQPHNFHEGNALMYPNRVDKDKPFINGICLDCHTGGGIAREKVPEATGHGDIFRIFPYREQYKAFLYDNKGKSSADGTITCQTCHDVHKWTPEGGHTGGNVEGDKDNSFLKDGVFKGFCAVCHGEQAGLTMYEKYHDKEFRDTQDQRMNELQVMRNLLILQRKMQNLERK